MKYDKKEIISTQKKGSSFFKPFISIAILVAIAMLFFPIIANKPEVYNDLIIEVLAQSNLNKSGELSYFWIILFISITIMVLSELFIKPTKDRLKTVSFSIIILITNLLYLFITTQINEFLIIISIVYVVLNKYSPKIKLKILVLSLFIYYNLITLCSIFALVNSNFEVNYTIIMILYALINLILVFFTIKKSNELIINRLILLSQLLLPLCLVFLLVNKYFYNETYIELNQFRNYRVIIVLLILCLMIYGVIQFKDKKNILNLSIEKVIFTSSLISIYLLNNIDAPALFLSNDWHHDGEEIIGWHQLINSNQTLFKDFFPASGLFSVFNGFNLNFILDGKMTSFAASQALIKILFSTVTVILANKYAGPVITLCIVVFVPFYNYDRVYPILVILLILANKKLIINENKWIQVSLLLTLYLGLYYPTYGIALFIGLLPFLCLQLYTLIKSGNLKSKIKNRNFILSWIFCLSQFILFLPILVRMAKHVLVYASQTVDADGISIFATDLPLQFFSFIPFESLRYLLYYFVSFYIPIFLVLLFIYFVIILIKNYRYKYTSLEARNQLFVFTVGIGLLLISYSYTLVRSDLGIILSRTRYIYTILTVFLVLSVFKYSGGLLKNKTAVLLIFILCCIPNFITSSNSNKELLDEKVGITSSDRERITKKIKSSYTVPDEYIKIKKKTIESIPRLGKGFIDKLDNKKIKSYSKQLKKDGLSNKYFLSSNLRETGIYVFNLKAAAVANPYIAKSKSAQEEIINVIKDKTFVFDDITSLTDYYLYYWLMVDKSYQKGENSFHYPEQELKNIYGPEYIAPQARTYRFLQSNDIGKVANSLGRSYSTLSELFVNKIDLKKHTNVSYKSESGKKYFDIKFNNIIKGTENDFLRIKFKNKTATNKFSLNKYFTKPWIDDDKKIKIFWGGAEEKISINQRISLKYGNGELLIPLGVNPSWLLSNNTNMRIYLEEGFTSLDDIVIEEAEFLKLKQ